ncbi:hypothetical protein NM688_g655 [Phlebia brevispora]|uniref:Uncharacterized protein n=1 Tax=Phlebia brevispora TaxID=194682 RepID=A0ACC1TE40_9APHY|nr:hypothetical protein NM688_g655 [Phlebia brevispora]
MTARRARSFHRRCRTEFDKPVAPPETLSLLRVLYGRLETSEDQRKRETEEYRAIIAEMATTCRTLQARIRVLETKQSMADEETRKRKELRRRTWQSSDSLSTSSKSPHSPCFELNPIPRHPQNFKVAIAEVASSIKDTPHLELRYDDEALLLKAWLWY